PTRGRCGHGDLDEENTKLREENVKLKTCLEKFTSGSQKLDLILNSQRTVYNKAGLGYRPKEISYISLVGRQSNKSCTKGKLAWVPKKYLSDISESSFWIPKKDIFRIM
ncbi:hypothetical protein, partial [Bifidobacterium breve]|uniref:hypothetical protein n=1 Tax=Bifidobacterium breve TaxID=1685 RepID=UPI001B7FD75F